MAKSNKSKPKRPAVRVQLDCSETPLNLERTVATGESSGLMGAGGDVAAAIAAGCYTLPPHIEAQLLSLMRAREKLDDALVTERRVNGELASSLYAILRALKCDYAVPGASLLEITETAIARIEAGGGGADAILAAATPPPDAIDDMRQNPSRFLARAAEVVRLVRLGGGGGVSVGDSEGESKSADQTAND